MTNMPVVSLPIGVDLRSVVYDPGGICEARVKYNRAVHCFKRTMRRHKNRANAQGLGDCASYIGVIMYQCLNGIEEANNAARFITGLAQSNRQTVAGDNPVRGRRHKHGRHFRFFYGLAANACAKLAEAQRQMKSTKTKAEEESMSGWKEVQFRFGSLENIYHSE